MAQPRMIGPRRKRLGVPVRLLAYMHRTWGAPEAKRVAALSQRSPWGCPPGVRSGSPGIIFGSPSHAHVSAILPGTALPKRATENAPAPQDRHLRRMDDAHLASPLATQRRRRRASCVRSGTRSARSSTNGRRSSSRWRRSSGRKPRRNCAGPWPIRAAQRSRLRRRRLRKLCDFIASHVLASAAPFISAGLDITKGILNTIDAGLTWCAVEFTSRHCLAAPGKGRGLLSPETPAARAAR
jgi:hypothetical protein